MFTLVTRKTNILATLSHLTLAALCVVFNYIYEQFSYGESSPYMQLMFLAPLVAAILYLINSTGILWIKNHLSLLLLNTSVAIVVSGCIVKGIIEISGRTTTYEQPYWFVAAGFFLFSIVAGLVVKRRVAK